MYSRLLFHPFAESRLFKVSRLSIIVFVLRLETITSSKMNVSLRSGS